MPYAASLSQLGITHEAVAGACSDVQTSLRGATPDLTFVFASHHHRAAFPELAGLIQQRLDSQVLLGCSAESVAGGNREIENEPALCVWSAVLPETTLLPFHLQFERTPDGIACGGWPEGLDAAVDSNAAMFLIGEPFTTAIDQVIDQLNDELPGTPLIGGMASGGRGPGQNCVFLGDRTLDHGAAGVAVLNGPQIDTVVSQGCRPVGPNFIVTQAHDNIIETLGGKSPLEQLNGFYSELPERDQNLIRQGPHVGIVMNEYQESFDIGDFLISNVVGIDGDTGAIGIGNSVRVGQTVRFHVRDANTADEELNTLLQRSRESGDNAPEAALLFSCNGRGTRLFPAPDHDASTIQNVLGSIPLAGFFAQGELGPVAGRNHMHGYTASVAVFR